jgi:membrane protease YdiL (CAAX protease family)
LFGVVVPAQSLATLGVLAVLARNRPDWRTALRATIGRRDAIGLLTGAGLQLGLSLLAYWIVVGVFGGEAPTQEVVEAAAGAIGPAERLVVILGVAVLAPIAEEVVFRGVLLSAWRRTRGDRFAVMASAATFAGLHLIDPNAILAVPFLFVVGIVAAQAVIRTGRLGRAVMIHMGFNLVTVVALFTV